ncbi:kyphoscoliosis peptidase-like isoform X2 [Stegodyphus dumicola]|uniref:kyphoscoliosis peptidase-like isoform X2 n=1 Tax=Stegodyphus dumicola TaxID=202533 RepID=UPI0015AA73B5|nr:kyphoscoliosis peptidase-like isoform X2 [Stegodyphus dumicola]
MKVGVMGCGGSRASRLVSPLSKAVISWNGTAPQPTALQLKERLRLMASKDAAVQVGQAPVLADKNTQTDAVHFTEEDLETLLEDDAEEPEITDVETQTNPTSHHGGGDNVKSVLMQTDNEKSGSVKFYQKRQLIEAQEINIITIDIGVQAVKPLSDHCTQVNFSTYRISLMEFESAGWRLDYTSKSGKKLGIMANKRLSKMADFESQTDPVTRALAANAAGIESNVFSSMDSISPIAHIHKELSSTGLKTSQVSKSAIHESIARLLEDVEDSMRSDSEIDGRFLGGYAEPLVVKCDAGIQTDNDPITDEAPEFAARPPPCKKKEMIPCMSVFKDIDKRAIEVPESALVNIRSVVKYLVDGCANDIYKVRAFFRWIADSITYDWRYMDIKLSAEEVFQRREGVCKDYCKLFSEMCRLAGIRVKTLNGFAKGYDYRPGHQFVPGEDVTHAWNAVFIFGAWRFIDTTWGTGYTDHTGKFQQKLNEHFFLTDPEVMIWTHYPYDEMENNYSRWQLLEVTVSLEEFNALPKVTPYFFDYNMKIRSRPQNPVVFKVHKEVKIAAHEPMRWKYKLYPADEIENASLNNYVFCQLKEDRLVGSFAVTPPVEGRYYFKVYAKPEREMKEETNLHNVVIFLLDCLVAKKYIQPYPHNEVPWGPTQCFYDYRMKMVNQSGPMIVTWGGKRKLILEVKDVMLITYQLLDVEGIEMDSKDIIRREDKENRVSFTFTPLRVGMYKFLIFGMPKPKQKGKWRLPLIASYLIDCKFTRQLYDEDFPPPQVKQPEKEEPKPELEKKEKRKIKIAFLR